jgi:hypothetical protein
MRIHATSIVLLVLCAEAQAAPDLSSPKAAYRSYHQALQAGDVEAIKACVIADEKRLGLVVAQIAYNKTERRFRDAVLKAFPAAGKQLPDQGALTLAAIEKADAKIEANRAMLRTSVDDVPVELAKVGDAWKLDLNTLYNEDDIANVAKFRTAVAEVMDGMLPDIASGKFSTYEAITQALQSRVLMRAALPQEDLTTQPVGTQPSTRPGEHQ